MSQDNETPLMDDCFANLIMMHHKLVKRIETKEYECDNDPKAWEFHDEFRRLITDTEAVGTARGLFLISKYLPMFKVEQRLELSAVLANQASVKELVDSGNEDVVHAKLYAFITIYDSLQTQEQLVSTVDMMRPEVQADFEKFWDLKLEQNKNNRGNKPPEPQP